MNINLKNVDRCKMSYIILFGICLLLFVLFYQLINDWGKKNYILLLWDILCIFMFFKIFFEITQLIHDYHEFIKI